jgi:Fe(3+) dicitrate transport protein
VDFAFNSDQGVTKYVLHIALLLLFHVGMAQRDVTVQVFPTKLTGAEVFLNHTDRFYSVSHDGIALLTNLPDGAHTITVFAPGYLTQSLEVGQSVTQIEVTLASMSVALNEVQIVEVDRSARGMTRMRYIEADGLYAAKKNEIILPEEMSVNTGTNNGRQMFSKVPGVNVQETDAGGLQLGIGARGLDPKRTTNFNTRQDGYDISADALGYPESYYTPPMDAVERIELVRGAASLQYGTQFGGLLNFKLKRGAIDKPFELTQRTTIGSYDHFGSFTSVGGKTNVARYYAYYQHKEGSGWRPNSFYAHNAAYLHVEKQLNEAWTISASHTHSFYTAKQAGGLTDMQFELNPSASYRDRNWFQVNWNVSSVSIEGKLGKQLTLDSKTFLVRSSRAALGFLGNITRVDTGGNRDLIYGEFHNVGNETRLIKRFNMRGAPGAILVGSRLYRGSTRNRQGKADAGFGPEFNFNEDAVLSGSDFLFPSRNQALFAEALLPLSSCWFVTPGVRYEHIRTMSEGYYYETNKHPLTGEILSSQAIEVSTNRPRSIALFGLGLTWRCANSIELFANVSQNYRAMNFSDLYVNNPNLVIAPMMKDESGYTIDLGVKGHALKGALQFDGGLFMMHYDNRIGEQLTTIENDEGIRRLVNYRSNIADARFLGVEMFEEMDLTSLVNKTKRQWSCSWYNNVALVHAVYVNSTVSAFDQHRVEHVPIVNYKTGLNLLHGGFAGGLQYNYVGPQYTDATNAAYYPDATVGAIPAYAVLDASCSYTWKQIRIEGSVNNALDAVYFTRRSTGYPGPGIIPAERRMFFMTLQVRI